MRRSTQVAAPLLAAAALSLLTGCRKPDMQRCVDEHNNVVPDSYCRDEPHPIGFVPMYRYYYGGWGSYNPGTHAEGGGYIPAAGHSYTTRGGFGSSFGSSAGDSSSGHAGSAGA
jgi:hypothetical protein